MAVESTVSQWRLQKNWRNAIHFTIIKSCILEGFCITNSASDSRGATQCIALLNLTIVCFVQIMSARWAKEGAWDPEFQCCSQRSQWWDTVWKSVYSKLQHWLLSLAAASLLFPLPAHRIRAIMLEMARGIHELMPILDFVSALKLFTELHKV